MAKRISSCARAHEIIFGKPNVSERLKQRCVLVSRDPATSRRTGIFLLANQDSEMVHKRGSELFAASGVSLYGASDATLGRKQRRVIYEDQRSKVLNEEHGTCLENQKKDSEILVEQHTCR
jgi:hypothetical protein